MALTSSKVIYKQHFGPLVPGVHIAPYPYCLHCKVQQEKVRGEGLLRGGDR
jgi:4-aminobutyrate aminotransferase